MCKQITGNKLSQIPISKTFNISRDKFAECELEIDSGCINGPLRFL